MMGMKKIAMMAGLLLALSIVPIHADPKTRIFVDTLEYTGPAMDVQGTEYVPIERFARAMGWAVRKSDQGVSIAAREEDATPAASGLLVNGAPFSGQTTVSGGEVMVSLADLASFLHGSTRVLSDMHVVKVTIPGMPTEAARVPPPVHVMKEVKLPEPEITVDQVVHEDVTFGQGVKGILVRPASGGPYLGVVHLHGSGDTAANNVDLLEFMAHHGFVVVDVDYVAGHELESSLAAVDYVAGLPYVKHGHIGVDGYSLGGRYALMCSERTDKIGACSSQAGRTTSGEAVPVMALVDKIHCPVLVQHGTADTVVPYSDSVVLVEKLKALGRTVDFHPYEGSDHSMPDLQGRTERVMAFFRQYLP